MNRNIKIERKTKETEVTLELNIDGKGIFNINTSVPFLNHMIELASAHGFFDIIINARGDTNIDFHHIVEDIGIVLGKGFKQALGEKKGIIRFGMSQVPMDESLTSVCIDISGRPLLIYNAGIGKEKVGNFDVELVKEFFKAFSGNSGMTIHINTFYGENVHHIIESIFKNWGRALNQATRIDPKISEVLSTKGSL
ncbi:MAG: imidazoleglycerol-phosphate dehydratase HisB [Thermodesulfobacteriota bacterium]|nr:imidazoleglycerol-phosphate dehydratase HisB [Thermodesulfobacteriota bacterium]